MPPKKDRMASQFYILQSAIGYERGPPIAFFTDPFKAMAAYNATSDMSSAFMPCYSVFLVAYMIDTDGRLIEIEELGRK